MAENGNDNIFSIGDGSLVDLNNQSVPNFTRPSVVNMERFVDGSLQLQLVGAFHPAFDLETGSFLLEPAGINLITHNMDLSQNIWQKGSNVSVRVDYAGRGNTAPDGTPTADRLRWDTGNGASQLLRRTIGLDAATTYTLSAILRLAGGLFGGEDGIRLTGDVVGTPKLGLAGLNTNVNRYQLLELSFTTSGRVADYPGNVHEIPALTIASVGSNSLTLILSATHTSIANAWVGGQLLINGQYYLITGNAASASGQIVVTLSVTGLPTLGITAGQAVQLRESPSQTVTIEFYSESTASIDWGGLQLEARDFRTSPIYQQASILVRSASLLSYRKSPIANMKTFGIFAEMKRWKGDGNLFEIGNLKAWIEKGKLKLIAGSSQIELSTPLPTNSFKLFVQVLESNSSLVIYLNGVLVAKTTLGAFRGDTYAALVLTSNGLREWQRFLVKDVPLVEGQVAVGEAAKAEVAAFFRNLVPINSVAISAHSPLLILPPVTVPAVLPPIAQTTITALNGAIATVTSATNFVVNAPVTIKRGDYTVLRTVINTISGSNITLATAFNALIGDVMIYGAIDIPGTASVRFPFDAIDPQIIQAIDVANKRLTVGSTLSFTKERAFIRNDLYQDISEVLILSTNDSLNWLFVNDVTDLKVGQTIAQPSNEQWIDVDAYFAWILTQVDGVRIAEKYINGIVLENTNSVPVTVTPALRVNL